MPTALILSSNSKHTGPGRVALQHAALLKEAGMEVLFCSQRGGTLEQEARKIGVWHEHTLHLPTRGLALQSLGDVFRLRSLLKQRHVQIIFTYRSPEHLTTALASGSRLPIVRFVHSAMKVPGDVLSRELPRLTWFLLRSKRTRHILSPDPIAIPLLFDQTKIHHSHEAFFTADQVLKVSFEELLVETAEQGIEFVPGGVKTLTPDPDESALLRKELKIPADRIVVGIPSRLKEGRGHDLLFAALAQARQKVPNLHALVLGRGSDLIQQQIQKRAEETGVADHVSVVDPGDRFYEHLELLDIGFLAHPGSAGTGQAALEMMRLQKPCVFLPVGVLSFLDGEDHQAAAVVPAAFRDMLLHRQAIPEEAGIEDPVGGVAEALVRYGQDEKLRSMTGKIAARRIESLFGSACLQQQLSALVTRLTR